MSAGDERANDAPTEPNPIRHDLTAIALWAALGLVEWWDDRGPLERFAAIAKTLTVLACATVLVITLGGCRNEQPAEVPGIDQGHVPFQPEQALVGRLNNALENRR